MREYKTPKSFKYVEKAIKKAETNLAKDIEGTKNPIAKQIKKDLKTLCEIESAFRRFKLLYGAEIAIIFPNDLPNWEIEQFLDTELKES